MEESAGFHVSISSRIRFQTHTADFSRLHLHVQTCPTVESVAVFEGVGWVLSVRKEFLNNRWGSFRIRKSCIQVLMRFFIYDLYLAGFLFLPDGDLMKLHYLLPHWDRWDEVTFVCTGWTFIFSNVIKNLKYQYGCQNYANCYFQQHADIQSSFLVSWTVCFKQVSARVERLKTFENFKGFKVV